jgi:hypothetical protein
MTWKDVGLAAMECRLRITPEAKQLGGDLTKCGTACRLMIKDTIQPNPIYVATTFRGSVIFASRNPRRMVFLSDSDLQGDEAVMVHRWFVEGSANSGCSLLFVMRRKGVLGEEFLTPVLANPFQVYGHPRLRTIHGEEICNYLEAPIPESWFK